MLTLEHGTIAIAAVGQTLFVLFYVSRPWWRHFVGRALFFKSLALMLLVDMAVVHWLVEYGAEELVEDLIYVLVTVAIWFQLGALLWQQRIDRRHHR